MSSAEDKRSDVLPQTAEPGASSAEGEKAVRESDTTAAKASGSGPEPEPEPEPASASALPPLSAHEFKQYNRLAEHMDYFHNHFRHSWKILYEAASGGRRPGGVSLKQFIDEGLHFIESLTAHHNIEETYIFPVLARKMPDFQSGGKGKRAAELLRQHKEIHKGMDTMEEYLRKCRNKEVELEMGLLKAKMDTWGGVLSKHLDQEVETLRAENMRNYWTVEEIRRIPM